MKTSRDTSEAARDEADLWRRDSASHLEPARRNELVSRHLYLVKRAAGRIAGHLPPRFDPEDCYGAGALSLLKAIDEFDPARGVPFEAFAYPRVYGAMVDHVRAQDWAPRGARAAAQRLRSAYFELAGKTGRSPSDDEIAEYLSLSIEELDSLVRRAAPVIFLSLDSVDENAVGPPTKDIIPETDFSPSSRLEREELVDLVADAIAQLNENERAVVVLHYHEGLMFKEVAEILSLSRARISQLHAKALLRLRAVISLALQPKLPSAPIPLSRGGGNG